MPSDIDSLLKKKNEKYIEVIFIPSCLILPYSRDEKNDQSSPYQPAIVRWPCLSMQRNAVICYCSVCPGRNILYWWKEAEGTESRLNRQNRKEFPYGAISC